MAARAIFPLKFPATCAECNQRMEKGTQARRLANKRFTCMACAPITRLAPATAEGAIDSSKKPMMTMAHAKALAMGTSGNPAPGKRRRLPSKLRRAAQQRNND